MLALVDAVVNGFVPCKWDDAALTFGFVPYSVVIDVVVTGFVPADWLQGRGPGTVGSFRADRAEGGVCNGFVPVSGVAGTHMRGFVPCAVIA